MKHLLTIGIMAGGLIGAFVFLVVVSWVMRYWWEPFKRKYRAEKWFAVCGKVKSAAEAVIVWGLFALIMLSVYVSIYTEL